MVGDDHTPMQILTVLAEISGLFIFFSEEEDTNFSERDWGFIWEELEGRVGG